MNERIKLLAEEAGIAIWGDAVYMYNPKDTLDSDTLKKFAELIIKECVDLVDTLNEAYDAPSTAGKFIKKHFGIEET